MQPRFTMKSTTPCRYYVINRDSLTRILASKQSVSRTQPARNEVFVSLNQTNLSISFKRLQFYELINTVFSSSKISSFQIGQRYSLINSVRLSTQRNVENSTLNYLIYCRVNVLDLTRCTSIR